MNIIFYSPIIDERSKEICKGLENSSRNIGLKIHNSRGNLENRLRQPLHGIALIILYLLKKDDLDDMIALQDLIIGLPIIIIMCDTAAETMAKARLLRPRFIFGVDDNLEDMCSIFEKMLDRQISYDQQQSKISVL